MNYTFRPTLDPREASEAVGNVSTLNCARIPEIPSDAAAVALSLWQGDGRAAGMVLTAAQAIDLAAHLRSAALEARRR